MVDIPARTPCAISSLRVIFHHRRSAAESYVSPAEAKRRTGDPATLSRIQSQMRHKVTEREGRVASLKVRLAKDDVYCVMTCFTAVL